MRSHETESFGDYILLHRIAVGGMAEVFLAQRRTGDDGELVVIKRLHAEMCSKPDFVAMFHDEQRLISRLAHPNIIRVYEFGQVGERYYIAMEQVWGESLATLSSQCNRRGLPFPFAAALYICAETAAALAHAHQLHDEQGRPTPVIHRDVTLGNVMVGYDGAVRVLDFGIAKAEDREAQTRVGQIKGTLAYLAPEQVLGGEAGPYTDVYQLGVLLYKVLVGREPFSGKTELQVMEQIVRGQVIPPRSVIPDFPPVIQGMLRRAMATKPPARFADMAEFERVLRAFLGTGFNEPKDRLRRIVATITQDRELRQRAFIHKLRQGVIPDPQETETLLSWSKEQEPKTIAVELGALFSQQDKELGDDSKSQANQAAPSAVELAASRQQALGQQEVAPDPPPATISEDLAPLPANPDTVISPRPELSDLSAAVDLTDPNQQFAAASGASVDSDFMDVFSAVDENDDDELPKYFHSKQVLTHVTRADLPDFLRLLEAEAANPGATDFGEDSGAGDVTLPPWKDESEKVQGTAVRELLQDLDLASPAQRTSPHSRASGSVDDDDEEEGEEQTQVVPASSRVSGSATTNAQPNAIDASFDPLDAVLEAEVEHTQVQQRIDISGVASTANALADLLDEVDLQGNEGNTQVLPQDPSLDQAQLAIDMFATEPDDDDDGDVFENTFDDIDFDIDVEEED